jgi:glycine/D-amino acid oxidase-like deaminating enzyme/nitrite reductase/ring-hydroxylating ferredoxin subunit
MLDQSLWRATTPPSFQRASLPDAVDVAIIGGGITGLTAAFLLKQAGKTVAVLEKDRLGAGQTGNTTAHLTYVTDTLLSTLSHEVGNEAAELVWHGHAAAIDQIESNVATGIDCGFRRVPGFICAPFLDPTNASDTDMLREEADRAASAGFAARFLDSGPITGKPAINFADQGLFHPLAYLYGLASRVNGGGSAVCEQCEVTETIDRPLAVVVNGKTIACGDIVVATHEPIVGIRNLAGATLFQTKLYSYTSYVFGARVDDSIAPGLYIDTSDPYFYLRVHEDERGRYAIFGGCDHKTGQESDTDAFFDRLKEAFVQLVPSAELERRWSGQVIESPDGLPYIGAVADHQYAATAYAGNGMTFGTLSGMLIRDAVTGVRNPLLEILDPNRKATTFSAVKRYIEENVDYPLYLITDRVRGSEAASVDSVARGDGKVMKLNGQRVAVHRRDDGSLVKVGAVCTHMGCVVRWNTAERTWDCPCHGSRFSPEGEVVGGPAESPLEAVE